MPGSIKNGGIWRSATGLYIKVGGTWRTVTSAYVKVGGQWKQWFASKIQDAFNRTSTAAGLGTADSGQAWNATSGNWRINGSSQAQSDDSASNYPIASANLGNTDVKVQADVSGGVGPAFWVSSAGSWWAAVPRYTTYQTSSPVCNGGLATCYGSGCNPSGNCCSGVSQSQSNDCNGGYVSSQSYPPSNNCCSGISQSGGGSSCSGGLVSSGSNPPAGNCCSGVTPSTSPGACNQGLTSCADSTCSGKGCCSGVSQGGGGSSYVCNSGYTVGGTEIISQCCTSAEPIQYTSYYPAECSTYAQCSGTLTISSGYSYFNIDRYVNGGTSGTQDSCSNYGAVQVSCGNSGCTCNQYLLCCRTGGTTTVTCSCTTATLYACYTATTLVNNPVTYSCYTSYSPSTTTYSCYTSYVPNPVTYSCYTSYTSTITRSCYTSYNQQYTTNYLTELVILSSASSTVVSAAASTISNNTSGYTNVGSIYVTTGGNAISAYAYSGSNLTGSQLGSTLNHTATNPTKGTSVGIIKAPSSGSQGSTADNFLATI